MYLKDLKAGKGLDIFITRDQFRYHLHSKIEGTSSGRVYITQISSGNIVFKFRRTDSVEIVYKERDRTWKWPDVKPGAGEFEEKPVHFFESFAEGDYFNRRDTFRVQIMKKVEMIRMTPVQSGVNVEDFEMDLPAIDLSMNGIEKTMGTVVVKDISESGIGFYAAEEMKVGDKIRVYFETEFGKMSCEGLIVRSVENIWKQYRLFYGCAFNKTDKNLAKFIYEQQRIQLSKENKK